MMRFDTSQNMKLGQQMKLSPRMIQSMEILQMPILALAGAHRSGAGNEYRPRGQRGGGRIEPTETERETDIESREMVVGRHHGCASMTSPDWIPWRTTIARPSTTSIPQAASSPPGWPVNVTARWTRWRASVPAASGWPSSCCTSGPSPRWPSPSRRQVGSFSNISMTTGCWSRIWRASSSSEAAAPRLKA